MTGLFIDGSWRDASDGGTRDIRCPADATAVCTVSEGTEDDARVAVAAARSAFDDGRWSLVPSRERGAMLDGLADRLADEKETVARLEALDTGKRMVEARLDMDDIIGVFRHFARLAGVDAGRVIDTGQRDIDSRVVHEPVGVGLARRRGQPHPGSG